MNLKGHAAPHGFDKGAKCDDDPQRAPRKQVVSCFPCPFFLFSNLKDLRPHPDEDVKHDKTRTFESSKRRCARLEKTTETHLCSLDLK